jgi:hypothetical protein
MGAALYRRRRSLPPVRLRARQRGGSQAGRGYHERLLLGRALAQEPRRESQGSECGGEFSVTATGVLCMLILRCALGLRIWFQCSG